MGIVMQAQRRAIEDLAENAEKPPKTIESNKLYLADKKRLYILGVSPGIGTCSDIHKMDVLVVTRARPEKRIAVYPGSAIKNCKYVVLLRQATNEEIRQAQEYLGATSLMAVELLKPILWDDNRIVFKRTGRVKCYAQFV